MQVRAASAVVVVVRCGNATILDLSTTSLLWLLLLLVTTAAAATMRRRRLTDRDGGNDDDGVCVSDGIVPMIMLRGCMPCCCCYARCCPQVLPASGRAGEPRGVPAVQRSVLQRESTSRIRVAVNRMRREREVEFRHRMQSVRRSLALGRAAVKQAEVRDDR